MDNFYDVCKFGSLALIEQWIKKTPSILNDSNLLNEGFKGAYSLQRLDVVKFLYHILTVDYLKYVNSTPVTPNYTKCLLFACKEGAIDIVIYAIAQGAGNFNEAAIVSCRYGHLELTKYLFQNYTNHIKVADLFEEACRNDHLEIVKFLAPKVSLTERGYDIACSEKFDDLIQFFKEEKDAEEKKRSEEKEAIFRKRSEELDAKEEKLASKEKELNSKERQLSYEYRDLKKKDFDLRIRENRLYPKNVEKNNDIKTHLEIFRSNNPVVTDSDIFRLKADGGYIIIDNYNKVHFFSPNLRSWAEKFIINNKIPDKNVLNYNDINSEEIKELEAKEEKAAKEAAKEEAAKEEKLKKLEDLVAKKEELELSKKNAEENLKAKDLEIEDLKKELENSPSFQEKDIDSEEEREYHTAKNI